MAKAGEGERQGRDLMRAVVADPDADGPRLAYAAWLQGQGQADRARLIVAQCQLGRLEHETRELLDRHGAEWGRPLAELGADRWEFRRGFPEAVHIPAGDLLRHHRRLAAVTPVRSLELGPTHDADLALVARLPLLRHLRSLTVGHPGDVPGPVQTGPAGLEALAGSKHLRGLERLAVHSHAVGAAGAMAIARSAAFPGLTDLTLDDPALGDARRARGAGDAIAGAPGLARLRRLQLGPEVVEHWALREWRRQLDLGHAGGRST